MPKITLFLKGLLVLSAHEGKQIGKVGFLNTRPRDHDLTIKVTRQPPTGGVQVDPLIQRPQIQPKLELTIINPTEPKITIRNKTRVDRKATPQNRDSFYWFVDLERAGEMYSEAIGVIDGELVPLLTFNSGQLYTVEPLSRNFLLVQDNLLSLPKEFGRVAITLGIDFNSEKAVFMNGNTPIFESATQPNTNYLIEINHEPKHYPAIVTDANYYHTALGPDIPLHNKKLFMSLNELRLLEDRLEQAKRAGNRALAAALANLIRRLRQETLAGPEAACFPAYLGRSNLSS